MIYPDWLQIDNGTSEALYVESIELQIQQDFIEIDIVSPELLLKIQQPELIIDFINQSIELEVI